MRVVQCSFSLGSVSEEKNNVTLTIIFPFFYYILRFLSANEKQQQQCHARSTLHPRADASH